MITEKKLLEEYKNWASDQAERYAVNNESKEFFRSLQFELQLEWWAVFGEWGYLSLSYKKSEDGTYKVVPMIDPPAKVTDDSSGNSNSASNTAAFKSNSYPIDNTATEAHPATA